MTSNTGPELTFGGATDTTADTTTAATTTPAEKCRQASRIVLIGGAVFTVVALVIMLIADADATVRLRSSELGTWALLIPSVLAMLLGIYGMTARKAYEATNAAKSFTTVGVLLLLFYLRMAYGVFA